MKQLKYLITSLFTLLCISSCEVSPADNITNDRTSSGFYVSELVCLALNSYITLLDDLLKFDAYLQADEQERVRILNYLLPAYEFYEKGDTLCFQEGGETWSIMRASTDSLTSPLASWRIGIEWDADWGQSFGEIPFGYVTFTRNEQGDAWVLDLKGSKGRLNGEGAFEIKKLTDRKLHASMLLNEYSIKTEQSTSAFVDDDYLIYISPERVRVKYKTTKPFYSKLFQNSRHSTFVDGHTEMYVFVDGYCGKDDYVLAELNEQNYGFITIHYKGITEVHPRFMY